MNKANLNENIIEIKGVLRPGYQVASGLSSDTPFPAGSLELQAPFFKKLGLDFQKEIPNLRWGTLNVDISPKQFKINHADYTFENVNWTDIIPPETFSFVKVEVLFEGTAYKGLIYYPHPETKPNVHEHNHGRLEVIAQNIENISYGNSVSILINDQSIQID